MSTVRFCLMITTLLLPATGWTDAVAKTDNKTGFTYPDIIKRFYLNFNIDGYNIILEGSPKHIRNMTLWLDNIAKIPQGRKTLQSIANSGNQVTIRHSEAALSASGRTLAPLSSNLTNHRGEDVEILFDARIPDEGSHWVFDGRHNKIAFTAIQNLYHELAHAKHLCNGSWRYFDSEGQAIEDENTFRLQQSKNDSPTPQRYGQDGLQFWWPGGSIQSVAADQ